MVSWLKAYWAAPVFEDIEKTRVASLLNITLITISAVAFTLTLVDGLVGVADVRVLLVGLITALLPLVLRFVMKRGHVRFASLLLSSLFLVNVTLAVYFAGTIRSPLSTIYIVGIVIAGLMVSYRAAIVFTVLSALALLGLLRGRLRAGASRPPSPLPRARRLSTRPRAADVPAVPPPTRPTRPGPSSSLEAPAPHARPGIRMP